MFKAIRNRLNRDDKGFTLIELMVVVLIIAILIAIAIPTFLGARTKAQDRAAEADLRQGLLTAKTYYTDNESFLDVSAASPTIATTATQYSTLEPSLSWEGVAAAPSANTKVDVEVATATAVTLVKKSKSGTWFCIADSTSGPTTFGKSTTSGDFTAGCSGGW
ncbi:MAG: prepilin-type N-terminal cleavage/methylation domain-containing protein [Actinomycetota bacterium]